MPISCYGRGLRDIIIMYSQLMYTDEFMIVYAHANDPSILLDHNNKTGDPHGASRYGNFATGVAPGIKSIRNSTCRCGGNPDRHSRSP
ncbi:hypothetical protein Tco_0742124 [Tanacetum coccineum]